MVCSCSYLYLALAIAACLISDSSGQCNDNRTRFVRKSTTVLLSPGYYEHGYYPPNSHCQWHLEAIDGGAVYIYVHTMDFGVSESSNCTTGDRVSIYSGGSSLSPLIARLCRLSDKGRHFYSTGRFVFVEFFSDQSVNGSGFRLEMNSVYRHPTTTATATVRSTTGSSETGGSSSVALLLMVVTGIVFVGLACLVCICRCVCNKCRTSDSDLDTRRPAPNHAQNTPSPAHYARSHAPSSFPAHLRNASGTLPLNSGWNYTHSSSGGNVSSAENGGHVNTGYSNFGEAPPPYEEIVVSENGSGQGEVLPSYSEAIRMSDITPKLDTVEIH